MQKAIFRIIALMTAVALAGLAGLGFGIRMQADYEAQTFRTTNMQSKTIAVVNQDMGVEYSDREINFSSEVINMLGDDCVLVSRAAAESGLQTGKYGAVISFPSDFSNKISQINAVHPEKAQFRYQVNMNLSQKDAIEVLLRILELEKQVNESISFMYATSVFGELHDAQATTRRLLSNDKASVEAVQAFSTSENTPQLSITDLEQNFPEVEYPDFSRHIIQNGEVMSSYTDKHREYMSDALDEYNQIREDVNSTISGTSNISDAIGQIDLLTGDQGDYIEFANAQAGEEMTGRLNEINGSLETVKEQLSVTIGSSGMKGLHLNAYSIGQSGTIGYSGVNRFAQAWTKGLLEELAAWIRRDLKRSYVNAVIHELGSDKIDEIHTTLGISLPEVMYDASAPGLNSSLNGLLNHADLTAGLTALSDSLLEMQSEGQMAQDLGQFRDVMEQYQKLLMESLEQLAQLDLEDQSFLDTLDNLSNQIRTSASSKQESITSSLNTEYESMNQTLIKMAEQISGYDPGKYVADHGSELSRLVENFSHNNRDWEQLVDAVLDDRTTLLFDTYEEYEEYVRSLQEDMRLVTEEAEMLLNANLKKLLAEQLTTSEDNQQLIGGFTEILPNTRIGSQHNNNFTTFMVAPIQSLEVGLGTQNAFLPREIKEVTKAAQWVSVGIYIVAGLFVLIWAGYFLFQKLHRRYVRRHSDDAVER